MKDRVKAIVDKYPNFSRESTGSNCEAYRHPLDNGGVVEITDGEDAYLPEPGAKFVCISMYDAESNLVKQDVNCAVKDLEKTIDRYIREGGRHKKEPKKGTRIPKPFEVAKGLLVFDLANLPRYMSQRIYIDQCMWMYGDRATTYEFQLLPLWSHVWVGSTKAIDFEQAMRIGRAVIELKHLVEYQTRGKLNCIATETYGEFEARWNQFAQIPARRKRRGAAK